MAYATYTTKALVCGSFNRNTADRSYLLFTREAGMLYADARSVREERSRQRPALQDFSLIRVSLVKGKNSWKVGSIEAQQNFYQEAVDKTARMSVVSIFRLLRRFVKGEEGDSDLFDFVVSSLTELAGEIEFRSFVVTVVQVRILLLLGYVDTKKVPQSVRIVSPQSISEQYSADIEHQLDNIYTHAVTMSHL